ncbi:hypothetical protein [Nostoc sp. CHAB 5715]|uniref:hypothetical protein n=1 Tax=Nostoc sp. CHAB 5715 TaxID=2780400 RepID=UPI001E58C5A5|nr:hypothetical protein [Nostoc sp. CHAB 5715]MCC5622164.1 hypothetical protein [Nostoc sp. CHAB 5715]
MAKEVNNSFNRRANHLLRSLQLCGGCVPYRKPTEAGRNLGYEVGSTRHRSLNPLFVSAMMGFPNSWVDISCDSQTLTDGCVLPQSPVSVGSLVMKLQRLRAMSLQNIANSIDNTKVSEDNTNNS